MTIAADARRPVPFLDLDAAYRELQPQIDAAVATVLRSGRYLLGEQNAAFEAELADSCSAAAAVTVGSGCDALELSLEALGVGPGDEVVVPSHTFIATWLAVSRRGAVPVPVEPGESVFSIDPAAVEAAITARTAAIVVVHLYGEPADLPALRSVAERHGLALLEDAAQAAGTRLHGRPVGAGSTAAAFSFYPSKNLGAMGDGGAVVTDDHDLARRVRVLRNYGSERKYVHDVRGSNARLDEVQAAILRVKLPVLDAWNRRRARLAEAYLDGLRDDPTLTLPSSRPDGTSAWHLFVVRSARRAALQEHLARAGVETSIHYPTPVHLTGAYADLGLTPGSLPRAEALADEVLSLPIGPHLSLTDVERVIDAVRSHR